MDANETAPTPAPCSSLPAAMGTRHRLTATQAELVRTHRVAVAHENAAARAAIDEAQAAQSRAQQLGEQSRARFARVVEALAEDLGVELDPATVDLTLDGRFGWLEVKEPPKG